MNERLLAHYLKVGDQVKMPGYNPDGKIVQIDEAFTRTPGGAARFATLETESGEQVQVRFSHCIKYEVTR